MPVHQKQITREYFYVFAAVCPQQGKLTALILKKLVVFILK
jgi:hypothetical protein